MKIDLDELMKGLHGYAPRIIKRPDGSLMLTAAHSGIRVKRVIDDSYTTDEVIGLVKFDLLCDSNNFPVTEVAKLLVSKNLPTYTKVPLCRTRSASLWESRKLKNL